MATEKILYLDGSDVVVTDSVLRVRSRQYRLSGITRHSISTVNPNRIPGILLIGVGLLVLIVAFNANEALSNSTLQWASTTLQSKVLLMIGGSISILAGTISLITTKQKYGVQIVTEQGAMNVLVSDRKEYVVRVVEALNKAFINAMTRTQVNGRYSQYPHIGMSVSH